VRRRYTRGARGPVAQLDDDAGACGCTCAGFDAEGALHFDGRVVDSRKQIGSTEFAALLLCFGVSVTILQFTACEGDGPLLRHRALVKWAAAYFGGQPVAGVSTDTSVRFPVILQHDGHSRLLVGE
jgi:hypothetical protein